MSYTKAQSKAVSKYITKTYDLFINENMKKHAKFMWNLTDGRTRAMRNANEYGENELSFEELMQTCHTIEYFYDFTIPDSEFDPTGSISINDNRLDGVGGYIINSIHLEEFTLTMCYYNYVPKGSYFAEDLEIYLEKYNNCIMKRINEYQKTKNKE